MLMTTADMNFSSETPPAAILGVSVRLIKSCLLLPHDLIVAIVVTGDRSRLRRRVRDQ
jgi:hypothetical protein